MIANDRGTASGENKTPEPDEYRTGPEDKDIKLNETIPDPDKTIKAGEAEVGGAEIESQGQDEPPREVDEY